LYGFDPTAINKTQLCLNSALEHVSGDKQLELLAEELRQAQHALDEITGEFYTEDLLDHIFSEFCIGK
jgi:tRNA modification GTPase